ncbi:MAG: hypothetical protein RI907_1018 [Pseudomonadota bacterium]|jgi:vitamin B12 transporter
MWIQDKALCAPGVRSACAVACGVMLAGVVNMPAWADDQLAPLVVTASRVPTKLNEVTADVTVIDQAQLARSQGKSLTEVLGSLAGVQATANGGLGKSSSLYIRGGDVRQVVLLVDGVRYGSATLGQPVFESLPISMIDRIEIVRGPMAALYGADAAVGVIQVFTRKGAAGWSPFASGSAGSNGYHEAVAGFKGGQGDWAYSLTGSDQATAGFSATNPRVGTNHNADDDGFRQRSFTGQVTHKLNQDWQVTGNLLRMHGRNWFDNGGQALANPPDTYSIVDSAVTGLGVQGRVLPTWSVNLRVAQSQDVSNVVSAVQSSYISRISTLQTQWLLDNVIQVGVGQVLVGLERTRQAISNSSKAFDATSRTIQAANLGWSGRRDAHDWQVNVRQDDNSQFGGQRTELAGYGFQLSDAWRLGGNVGTSFVAPSFNQLYWPQYGDPSLKPQRGVNRELNVAWSEDGATLKLVRFENRIRNFISTSVNSVSNIDSVRLAGWTLSGSAERVLADKRLYAEGSMDWLDAHNVSDNTPLVRRPDHVAKLKAGSATDKWDLGVNVLVSSGVAEKNNQFQMDRLPGYVVWGAQLAHQLNRDWKVSTCVDNLADHAYETVWGFNMPRRQWFVTLAYSPKSN